MFAVEEQGNEKLGEEEEVARLRELLDRFCNYIKVMSPHRNHSSGKWFSWKT
jgi:hypothetical protein